WRRAGKTSDRRNGFVAGNPNVAPRGGVRFVTGAPRWAFQLLQNPTACPCRLNILRLLQMFECFQPPAGKPPNQIFIAQRWPRLRNNRRSRIDPDAAVIPRP